MNNYEKLTLAVFKKRLKDGGHYSTLTGARRAIGKAHALTDPEKDKARALASRHFGEAGPQTAPKAAKKAAKGPKHARKKKANKKVTASGNTSSAAPKAASKAKAAAKKPGPKKGPSVPRTPSNKGSSIERMSAEEIRRHPAVAIKLSTAAVGTMSAAVTAIKNAREIYPDAEIKLLVISSAATLGKAVDVLGQSVSELVGKLPEKLPENVTRLVSKRAKTSNGLSTALPEEAPVPAPEA